MQLTLESGKVVRKPTEQDILALIEGEEFAILESREWSYMQCAINEEETSEYLLEYQEDSLDRHYQAVDRPITLQRVQGALIKYLQNDESWRTDFQWEKLEL